MSFAGKTLSLDYDKTSDLGLTVKSSLRDIHYHDGDFTWTIRPLTEGTTAADIGTIVDNQLHTAAKAARPVKQRSLSPIPRQTARSLPIPSPWRSARCPPSFWTLRTRAPSPA